MFKQTYHLACTYLINNAFALITGSPLILDFFLEDLEMDFKQQMDLLKGSQGASEKGASGDAGVEMIFSDMKKALSPSLVAQVKGVFQFNLSGR